MLSLHVRHNTIQVDETWMRVVMRGMGHRRAVLGSALDACALDGARPRSPALFSALLPEGAVSFLDVYKYQTKPMPYTKLGLAF